MTSARSLLAFAVVVGVAVVGTVGVGAIAAPAGAAVAVSEPDAATTASAQLAVELVPAAFGILRPGSDLGATVTLANRTDATVAAGTARLYLDSSPVADHVALADWIAGDVAGSAPTGVLLAEVATPQLQSGESIELPSILIPAASIVLENPADFGVHPLEARVSTEGTEVVGDRSSVTVDPGVGGPAASVTTVLPLTVATETEGLLSAETLDELMASGGSLARELDQADGRPIALAVDPRIILSIRALGTAAPASSLAWLDRLDRVPNVTFPLAFADSDIAATSQIGAGILAPTPFELDPDLFPATGEEGDEPTPEPSPTASASPSPEPSASPVDPLAPVLPTIEELLAWDYTRDDIAWPRDASVVAADLDTFTGAGFDLALLDSSNVDVASSDSAPSPLARVGANSALVSDSTVSMLFREAVTATTVPQWESAIARLTGALGAIADEGADAGAPQLTVATLARDSAGGPFRLAETLDVITRNFWSTGSPLTAAVVAEPVTATVVDAPVDPERLRQLGAALAGEAQAAQFSTVLDDPTLITGERRLALLALAAQGWATEDADWATAVGEYIAQCAELASSVRVDTTGTITVLADNGDLPISISNVLDYPVTVNVTVTSPRLLLSVRETQVPVTIEANSQRRASIPVQSIANGEVTISIALTSATGVAIGQTAFADVTVSAGWETAATTVLAVIVGLVFIAGIIRTVRRSRRGRALTADPAGEDPAEGDPAGEDPAEGDPAGAEAAQTRPAERTPDE